jgi:hypothetical protein
VFNVCCVISSHFSERVVLVFLMDDDVNLVEMQDWHYVQQERLYGFRSEFHALFMLMPALIW